MPSPELDTQSYNIVDLVRNYGLSPAEAERLLYQFGSDRNGLDLLLGHHVEGENSVEIERPAIDGDFLFSI